MHFKEFQGYIFDLDGVVWLGTEPVPGAAKAINAVREKGRAIRFLTNNASQHRRVQLEKLRSMGVEAELDEVITSASAAAEVLLGRFGPLKVHAMGTEDLAQEMRDVGHETVEEGADWVVVGFDRSFNYDKLNRAFQNVHYHGARFLACNENAQYPTQSGLTPGAGPLVAALEYATGREPDLIVGKPNAPIFEVALNTIGLPATECLMVADLLELDIYGAQCSGMGTLFVLSGVDSEEDIKRTGIEPQFVLPSVAELTW